MSFRDHPRLIGLIRRGSQQWQHLYAMRSASERTKSYDQEVIAKGSALKMRGLAAFSFAGSIRTLGQLLRRACNFVLDATYNLVGCIRFAPDHMPGSLTTRGCNHQPPILRRWERCAHIQ
jgi:hypothetical protein